MKTLLNLYTEELREKPIPYGFPWLLTALALVSLGMLAYGVFTEYRLTAMSAEHQALQERQQALKDSIAALEAKLASKEVFERIEQETAALTQDIQARERMLSELNGLLERSGEGFSHTLRGLAAASGQGVWLTDIHLVSGSAQQRLAEVRLIGRLHQGQHLPAYLDALARSEALRGLRFDSVQVQRGEQPSQAARTPAQQEAVATAETLTFMLSTRPDDSLQTRQR